MRKRIAWAVVIVVLALLGVGTVSNVVRLNATSARIREQAANGQAALDRQCRVLPVSKKLYAWGLSNSAESGITPADFELVVSTAAVACP